MTDAAGRVTAPERVAAAVLGVLLVLALAGWSSWDWLLDTCLLGAAVYLAWSGRDGRVATDGLAMALAIYAFVDAALQCLVALLSPGWQLLVFAALAGLFGLGLDRRLAGVGPSLAAWPWRGLFAAPARLLTVGAIVALGSLYLPMLHIDEGFTSWSGPMVVPSGPVDVLDAGRMVHFGAIVTTRGVMVPFGRVAALLLAGIIVGQLIRVRSGSAADRLLAPMRAAAALVAVWWLIFAQGWRSLGEPFNLLFVAGCAAVCLALLRPKPAS